MTMDLLGSTARARIDGPEEPAGTTTVLAKAQDAINLCI
jgi:peroxiredoxin family protein